MQQQLLQGTINIVPQTMNDVLEQIGKIVGSPQIDQSTFDNIIKALFYGLWNFDKMINQHNLSTAISLLPQSLPKQVRKNGLKFYQTFYLYLYEKWPFIDKHRINKFMQLIRYLIRQSFNFCKLMKIKRSKADEMISKTIFKDLQSRSGILYHVTDIYFEIITNYCVEQNQQFDFTKLQIFQNLLKNHQIQHFRHHIIAQIYGKYKEFLIDSYKSNEQQLQNELQKLIDHFLQMAKAQQKDLNRKNLYLLVGFLKSPHLDFFIYQQQYFQLQNRKHQKAYKQKQKIKKKLSKGKIKEIKQKKKQKKQKNKKLNKNKKIISKSTIELKKGKGHKKFIQDF